MMGTEAGRLMQTEEKEGITYQLNKLGNALQECFNKSRQNMC